jgi:hypothetical protein
MLPTAPGTVIHVKKGPDPGPKGDVLRYERLPSQRVGPRRLGWAGQRTRLAAGSSRRGFQGVRRPFWTAIPNQAERHPNWPKRKLSEGMSIGTRFKTRRAAVDALKAFEAIRREEYVAYGLRPFEFNNPRAYKADRAAYVRYRNSYDRGF